MRNKGLNVDVIHETASLDGYRLVIAPMLYLFHDGFEEKIRDFVENGGYFVLTYWSGIVDRDDRCFLGGTPYGVMDVFGMRRTETDALYEGECNTLCPADGDFLTKQYECRNLCDLIALEGGKALMTYGSEFYQGTPAVTENRFGKGMAYYVGADAEYIFVQNFKNEPVDIREMKLEGEILYGGNMDMLAPYESLVLRVSGKFLYG